MSDKPPPADNIETRPPLEWVATTAARLWRDVMPDERDHEGWNDPDWDREGRAVEIAWRIWQKAKLKTTAALATGVDWWALAFGEGTGFEDEAARLQAQMKMHPVEFLREGLEWKPFNEIAQRLYPGISRAQAFESLRALSRCTKWMGHYRRTERGLEFSPWQARELWHERKKEIARNKGKGANKPKPTAAAKPAARKQPCKRHAWKSTGAQSRACTRCGLKQAKDNLGKWTKPETLAFDNY